MDKISAFIGEYRWLSNFWMLSQPIYFMGRYFRSTEHLYQACKASNSLDFDSIAVASTPGEARKRGKKIKVRDDWDEIKLCVMQVALRLKFAIPELREKLLATGNTKLVEGNSWGDAWWGVDEKTGQGHNYLGKMLMKLRDEYKKTL